MFKTGHEKLDDLDLSTVCSRFKSTHKHLNLSSRNVSEIRDLYKSFLWLKISYPLQTLSPTDIIDSFWHEHILDTQKYFADCKALFGEYMHHSPSSKKSSLEPFQTTVKLVAKHFPELM
ncbi:MAG: hypothetical protein WCI18_07665 [Pseudomonadota bacterium]